MKKTIFSRRIVLMMFLVAIGFIGCASPRPKIETSPKAVGSPAVNQPRKASGRCGVFCEEIAQCAEDTGHAELNDKLCRLARCETGNKCYATIKSYTGKYQGAFQFSRQTWRSRCRPIFSIKRLSNCKNYSAMKDLCCSTACAAELIAIEGLGSWPACGRSIAD